MYGVRIVFEWQGQEVYEILGPFDDYFAMLVCIDFADAPYTFGMTEVRVKRAMVVAWL